MALQKKKIQFFETVIEDFFRKSGRAELPWRKKNISAYEVWVSEIMLQQTQVSRVITYYTRFLKKFPTVQSLTKASWEEFLPYYEGLGYYTRGRNMIRTAEEIVKRHKGIFPKTKKELLALPGIGDYTASAILSFAYGKHVLAWDTNLKRVVGRFFYGSKGTVIDTEKLESVFITPSKKLNAGLMDFGSSICTAKPKCGNCPLQKQCLYFQGKGRKEAVLPKEKVTFPTEQAQALLFLHQNHKQYYSSRKSSFVPFLLPKNFTSRSAIKAFFLEKFKLQLSVRPPHKKIFLADKATLLVNAQILLGEPKFSIFPKSAVTEYTEYNLK